MDVLTIIPNFNIKAPRNYLNNNLYQNSNITGQNKSKEISNDFFDKSANISFQGSKVTTLADVFKPLIELPNAEVHLTGTSDVDKVVARIVNLYNDSNVDDVVANYVTLFDDSAAKLVDAAKSVAIFTHNVVFKAISKGTIEVQPSEIGARVEELFAPIITLGQKANVGSATGDKITIINQAHIEKVVAKELVTASEKTTVDEITSQGSVRARGSARINKIETHNLGLSGNCSIGKATILGTESEVHIMNSPKFDMITFKDGNGKVILHPDEFGKFPTIAEEKIRGAIIEKTGKPASGPFMHKNKDELVEFHTHF